MMDQSDTINEKQREPPRHSPLRPEATDSCHKRVATQTSGEKLSHQSAVSYPPSSLTIGL